MTRVDDLSSSAQTFEKGHCSGPEQPPVDQLVDECFRAVLARGKFTVPEALEGLYERLGSWSLVEKRVKAYLLETGYDRLKGARVPSRTDWWKAANERHYSKETENALRFYFRRFPRGARGDLWRLSPEMLRLYLQTRC